MVLEGQSSGAEMRSILHRSAHGVAVVWQWCSSGVAFNGNINHTGIKYEVIFLCNLN